MRRNADFEALMETAEQEKEKTKTAGEIAYAEE